MSKKKEKMNKENKLGVIVLTFSALICVLALSYAVWTQLYNGEKKNEINTATLILTLDDKASDGINLINTIPVTDSKGLTFTPYTFEVTNSGTIDANYRILLVNDTKTYEKDSCSDKKLDWSNIKYSFSKNGEAATTGILSDTSGVLNLGIINSQATDSYSLRLWVKESATNEIMGMHFHGLIKVEAVQSDQSLDNE